VWYEEYLARFEEDDPIFCAESDQSPGAIAS
jgi:hypothetical protein